MKRPPLPPALATQGTNNQILFQPGGFDIQNTSKLSLSNLELNDIDDEGNDLFMGESKQSQIISLIRWQNHD